MRNVSGAKVLVIGMARSGEAAVELLAQKGALPFACDSKPLDQLPQVRSKLDKLNVPFRLQSAEALEGIDWVVVSPGVPVDADILNQARGNGIPVIGEVELASWFLRGRTIGITGSNGKTTTTSLTGHILRECGIPVQVGGNIGTPPTAMVSCSSPDQWNVLEISSFQLETIAGFRAHIGVGINVTPDHLDRHHTFEIYAAAKGRLFETQQSGDAAVLNADDASCVRYAELTDGKPVWFSLNRPVRPGAWLEGGRLLFDGDFLMNAAGIPLPGRHNIENCLAAAAAARLAGAPLEGIAAAIRTFPGVEHRLEFVRELNGVRYYNDSKATNVDATLKAIDAFDGGLWVILGGKDKGSDYTVLREPLRRKARAALLIGAAGAKISDHLSDAVNKLDCGDIETAVAAAHRQAAAGDTVLLAPACASFDQFQSYEHRGKVFKGLVEALPG